MVDLAGEHSNEDEHEKEDCDGEDQHNDALHEAGDYVFCLVVDLCHLRVGPLYVLCLKGIDFGDGSLVFPELILEASGELLHFLNHLQHVVLHPLPLRRLVPLHFVVVHDAALFLGLLLKLWCRRGDWVINSTMAYL